jgi:signal transduction histidine kinase/AmiR/NasT family two-component response regulator
MNAFIAEPVETGNSTEAQSDLTTESFGDAAMAAAKAGYWVYHFNTGKFSFSNSVKCRLSDDELRRIDQTGLWAIMETEDLPVIMKKWGELISDGKDLDLTYRVTTEMDGTMWQRSIGKVQYGSDGKRLHVIAFVNDITEDVAKNEALVAAEDASRAKSDFLARMSHEVKTPLNAIVGLTDSLKEEDLGPEAQNTVQLIEQSADGLNYLLSQALDHTRLMSEDIKVILHPESPADIVRNTASHWRPKCSLKSLQLNVNIDPDVPDIVPMDRFRVQQCLNNLLSNAIKFTSHGRIDIDLKYLEQDNLKTLVMIIRDTGIGMTDEQCQTVMKPFEQVDTSIKRRFGGTGLGLSIADQLVHVMGGQMSVRSVLDKGTAIAIGLPVTVHPETENVDLPDPTEARPSPQPNDASDGSAIAAVDDDRETLDPETLQGLSILCVEDNPTNQHVVKKLIGKQVSALHFADNGREALEQLQKTEIDIILMDIHMPIMDGIEATIEIRNSDKDWANVIIIALTADADYQQVRICRNLGMNDTIGKPVRRKDILEAFDRVLENASKSHGRKVKLSAA